MNKAEIEYLEIEENFKFEELINKVLEECFFVENMQNSKLYIDITLTNPENIKKINNQYRNINKETDVLSFPMFEKKEIENVKNTEYRESLGDIVISIERVIEQANEYEHTFEREFAYMLVHGFYHLMGEDHIEEDDKKIMREKEEYVLNRLQISR